MFICSSCGARHVRWAGKCDSCGEWNTLQKSEASTSKKSKRTQSRAGVKPVLFSEIKNSDADRLVTHISELDQVLGGGFVHGSITLLSGDPGIGKSTLVLQLLHHVSKEHKVLYISGEESAHQVKGRASRLGIREKIPFISETSVDSILFLIESEKPDLVVIDSIQTMFVDEVTSSAGSVAQVRESSIRIINHAKKTNTAVLLIGHVTKGGTLAGPRVLEHLVDTVLYLEGDRYHSLRMLRGVKNRFGSTNEAGVFEMKDSGLQEVANPSELFLEEREEQAPGNAVAAILEGNRSFLLEVQALVTRTHFGYPKRTSSGFDQRRLELLIAVLTKRAHLKLDTQDVYVNVVGGFKISEPASDLAVCLAIASSFLNTSLGSSVLAVGEVGLSGEVRGVSQLDKRLAEGKKLGFDQFIVSKHSKPSMKKGVIKAGSVQEILKKMF